MPSVSTQRKIKIIENHYQKSIDEIRKDNHSSIDEMYNTVVGDNRKNFFCKVSVETKDKIDMLLEAYQLKNSEFLEILVEKEYIQFQQKEKERYETMKQIYTLKP